MQKLLEKLFDILFPPRNDALCVRHLTLEKIQSLYTPHEVESVTALSHYSSGNIRALIHEAKFRGNARAQKILGGVFRRWIETQTVYTQTYIIPVPLAPLRERERGYNQVTQILHEAHITEAILATDILIRTRNTRPQTELARTERLSNTKKAFAVRNPEKVRGAHIILVDDVCTTGATMHAAKAALLPHVPASITCIAIAH